MLATFGRCFTHNILKGLALIVFLVIANATTTVSGADSNFNDCWNPHTAQVTTLPQGTPCPKF